MNDPFFIKQLQIKEIELRISTLAQARDSVDLTIHVGGAFSALVPLVALYYGNTMRYDVENPTALGQDLFILSKGHAVASLASIYADLGYFSSNVLRNSRSYESILNGHPGPLLPGVHTATGPMGQGICVAGGLAVAGRLGPDFDVFCLTGDGELQEGTSWEAIMYAGDQKLHNLCVIVDNNRGQLDDSTRLHIGMDGLADQFRSFGWNSCIVDGTRYDGILAHLHAFKNNQRDGRPTAIISRTEKGQGGFSNQMIKHKAVLDSDTIEREIGRQRALLEIRKGELVLLQQGDASPKASPLTESQNQPVVSQAQKRDKEIACTREVVLDKSRAYTSDEVISLALEAYADGGKVATIDADLSVTSGLFRGIAAADRRRGLNTGVAEANMMCIGEAFAILGYNSWVSTFCPFFNWNVMRRIAVGYQERLEVMAKPDGWLTKGHGLDLTFVATAPNFETKTNGATHMGNDDVDVFRSIPSLKIIDVACPLQLLSVIRWIMEGNRGLVYMRVMRAASPSIYKQVFPFEYGRGYQLGETEAYQGTIVSSGRGVHEALGATNILREHGVATRVIDMPSVDAGLMLELHDEGKPVVFAEQNNGFLYDAFRRILFSKRHKIDISHITSVNTLSPDGDERFLHSGTYEELMANCGLLPQQIADRFTLI